MQWEDTGSLQHVSKDLDGRIMAMKITLRPRSKSIYSTIRRRQFGKALEEHELKELSKDKQATKFQYPEKALREWGKTNWKSILTILWLWFGEWNLKTYNTRFSFNGIKSRGHYTHLREVYFHFNCNDLAFTFPEMFPSSFFCTFHCLLSCWVSTLNSCIPYEILLLIDFSGKKPLKSGSLCHKWPSQMLFTWVQVSLPFF